MRNKTYIIATIIFSLGVLMLLGSSYSLIMNNYLTNETYGFEIANFDVQFSDKQKINISGIPESDKDGIINSNEFVFTVSNNSDYNINYRLDILDNSNNNMNHFIHYIYAINDEPYSEILSLDEYYTIKQNKVLKTNETDTYKIKMWLSIDADESYMNKAFSANISLSATQNDYKYATNVIEKLANNNLDNIVFENKNYRYSDKNSSNYLWFNCRDNFTSGEDYCEKWQIIGSFINKKENARDEYYMLKIINTKSIYEIPFNIINHMGDYNNSYIESFANGSYYDKLNNLAKKFIIKAKWNIGNTKGNDYLKSLYDEKQKSYYGYVGLLNVSDYLFLQNNSYIKENNILFINKDNSKVNILNNKIIKDDSENSYNFLPCVYLRPDLSIIKGNGSIDNPYEIDIKYPMNY